MVAVNGAAATSVTDVDPTAAANGLFYDVVVNEMTLSFSRSMSRQAPDTEEKSKQFGQRRSIVGLLRLVL